MFKGFSPETIDFLWGIRFNNNRDWFNAHKDEYKKYLYEPMQELAEAVRTRYSLEGTVLKASRIYRDVRFSGGIPYKEHLWFCIRQPDVFWSEHPSVYFQIEPEGGSCGFIHYAPPASVMAAHRKRMLVNPQEFPAIMQKILQDERLQDHSARYKRPKPGSVPELESLYNLKNCFVGWEIPVGDTLFSKNLPDTLVEVFREVQPLYDYFKAIETAMMRDEA